MIATAKRPSANFPIRLTSKMLSSSLLSASDCYIFTSTVASFFPQISHFFLPPMTSAIPNKPHQTAVALDFLVIGGSSAGLSAAYALRRVGHRALILEKNVDFFDMCFVLLRPHPSDAPPCRSINAADTEYHPICQKSFTTGV